MYDNTFIVRCQTQSDQQIGFRFLRSLHLAPLDGVTEGGEPETQDGET